MNRIELSDDGWIELRDPEDLRDGDLQDIIIALREVDPSNTTVFGYTLRGLMLATLTTACNVPYLDDPERLPNAEYDLARLLRIRDGRKLDGPILTAEALLWPKPASVDDYEDPTSPTEPASD